MNCQNADADSLTRFSACLLINVLIKTDVLVNSVLFESQLQNRFFCKYFDYDEQNSVCWPSVGPQDVKPNVM